MTLDDLLRQFRITFHCNGFFGSQQRAIVKLDSHYQRHKCSSVTLR